MSSSEEENHLGDDEGELQSPEEDEGETSADEVLDEVAESDEGKDLVRQMFGMKSSPVHAPVFEEVNSDHIDKIIDHTEKQDRRQYKYATSNRWFNLAYFSIPIVLGIAFIIFLVVYLPLDSSLLTRLMDMGLGFIGGLGAAFAFRNIQS